MNLPEYDRMYDNEDRYWWFVSRRELVVRLVRWVGLKGPARLVDVGCGTGATAQALGQFGEVVGVDLSDRALSYCRRRGVERLVQGRVEALPLPSDQFDVLVATDIVEHLDDDLAGLKEFHRILKPGGRAVVTVPAYEFLWSEHDVALMHRRRYVARQLAQRAREAGFELDRLSYALCLLMPLAFGRLLKRKPASDRPPEAQIKAVPAPVNKALILLQRFEAGLMRFLPLPFGLSVVAVLRKPVSAPKPHLRPAHRGADRPMSAAM